MAQIINGKEISTIMRQKMKDSIATIVKRKPGLAVIIVGDNPASEIYVNNKVKACEFTGIKSYKYELPNTVSKDELISLIDKLNHNINVDGILVQLPLPKHLDEKIILNRIDSSKDVDGFGIKSAGLLSLGCPQFVSCTPLGIMKLLEYSKIDINGKNAVVVGRSNIVGKPMAQLLLMKNATVTVCHSKTKDLKSITSKADILVVAIGKAKFLKQDMVKPGAVVIDVGMNRDNGQLCGDVDFDNVENIASYITPVPRGVGPMTITMLLYNTIKAYEIHETVKIPISF